MPDRVGPVRYLHELSVADRAAQGDEHQLHWYRHVCKLLGDEDCRSVLDVGAGGGSGARVLGETFSMVDGIDPLPFGPGVTATPIEVVGDQAYDVVTAIDVIEHVERDAEFLEQLVRVARWFVFLSTPNYNVSQCTNAFHVREYTPSELRDLLESVPSTTAFPFVSDSRSVVHERRLIVDDEAGNNFGVLLHV